MFESQKNQNTAGCYSGNQLTEKTAASKPSASVPLAAKAQELVFSMNRIEDKARQIQRILFGINSPDEVCGKEPCSVDDVLDELGRKAAAIDYNLDITLRRLTEN